jgi:hypothetical protein
MVNRRVLHVTSPRIESRFDTLELRFPLMKKKKATNRDGLAFRPIELFGMERQFLKCFFACSSKWPLICNFTSATFESGCRLGFLIQSFADWMTWGLISGRCSRTASMARMRPSVSSFVMRLTSKFPKLGQPARQKRTARRGRKFTMRYGIDKFIGGLPNLLFELDTSIP